MEHPVPVTLCHSIEFAVTGLTNPDLVLGRLRSSSLENELARLLRAATEQQREDFLLALLKNDRLNARLAALALVRWTVNDRTTLLSVLEAGLARKDASEIKKWLDAVGPRLGVDALLSLLEQDNIDASMLVRCWYYLMIYLKNNDVERDYRVQQLKNKIEIAYYDLSPDEQSYWAELR